MNWGVFLASCFIYVRGDVIKPIHLDDPELYIAWSTPRDIKHYKTYATGAEFVGNLFAGRAEFSWIVDVRYEGGDIDTWSTGNLITAHKVLVSARSVGYWERYEIAETEEQKKRNWYYVREHNIEVSYCTTFLHESERPLKWYTDWKYSGKEQSRTEETGTKPVFNVFVDPKANPKSMLHDLAVLDLRTPIKPIVEILGYMPIAYDPKVEDLAYDFSLENMEQGGIICYIASFGRNFVNIVGSYVVDYKVKYRVYWLKMVECAKEESYYEKAMESFDVWIEAFDEETNEHLDCFKTRARPSAVCDHDKGAPLVCDGRVYGIVSRGVRQNVCSNLLPMTFIVARAAHFWQYYRHEINSSLRYGDVLSGATREDPHGFTISLFLLCSVQLHLFIVRNHS